MDYYELLGVPTTATTEQIKRAYKKIARENHPDATKNNKEKTELFKQAALAYEALCDPNTRASYNAKRPKHRPRPPKRQQKTSSVKSGIVPPEVDLWGKPLSEDEKRLWILENMVFPPELEIRELRDKINRSKKYKKNKKEDKRFFYPDPEDLIYTEIPIDGMHYHNPPTEN